MEAPVSIRLMHAWVPTDLILHGLPADGVTHGKMAEGQSAAHQPASNAAPWAVEDFVIGKIPEDPPPFEVCH